MADVDQHPVFFEVHGLDETQRRKVKLYFRNHRKSGGGECGDVRKVTDNIYCIDFQHQEDQRNVLQRSKHEVAGCSLVLTDRCTVEPLSSCSSSTSTSSQEYTQSPKSVPTSNPPPSGDYEQHPDTLPPKAGALLRPCSPHQTTDGGIVGTHCQVDPDGDRDSHLSERQTSIHQLGEAKLQLLWKDINHCVVEDFPGVKVSRGDSGRLVVDGSMEEIRMVVNMVSDKENLVLQKTVSVMGPHLTTFLRRAYGGPGVLADVLGLGDEVVIELGDTELCVFSLSADKLDKADTLVRSEFREVKLDVPNCSALPELQETNEMNQGQCRAQAVFTSDSTVYLLGHSKEVEELRETVTQYILDESNVQRTFHIPPSVSPQEFFTLLQVYDFDCLGITIHPPTSSSENMVILEGPSKKVSEVKDKLGVFLDSLLEVRTVKCSQRPSSTENISKVTNDGHPVVAGYSLCDGLQVLVCRGDITKLEADALVNAANEDLDHCGGVAAALSKAGGPEVQKESEALVKQTGKIPTGDVVVTTGGNLKCKKLLHAVGPRGGNAGGRESCLLKKTVRTALDTAEKSTFSSIAFPCIGSGASGVPVAVCAEALVTAVEEFSSQGGRSLSRIILIDNREEVVRALQEACERVLNGAAAPSTARGAAAGAAEDGVHIEIGSIETQQVDAVVSPMVGHDPLSTRVGNTLVTVVGSELTARFRKETEEETLPGDSVLVEALPGLPFSAVFFLNLVAWDEDRDGTAVEVLKLAISNTLRSCEQQGFRSVALPLLGAGIALRFPDDVVAEVLQEQIDAFQESRGSRTPFHVHIVIHPEQQDSAEVFKSHQETFTKPVYQPDQRSTTKRVVLLGKTGTGKSSLANAIFGEELFTVNHSPNSGTKECQAETRSVNERSITLIDTPGLFDTGRSEKEVNREIVSCITECAPGPHAFLILLKVDKFTKQERAVISKICGCFSEEALRHAVVVFTHGEQLGEGMKIEDFVGQNESLSDLVKKCGGRCHVFDNKNWKNRDQEEYRSNRFQVEELLSTIDEMVNKHEEDYYTNDMLQVVEETIQTEEKLIKASSGHMSAEEIRKEAKRKVSQRFWVQLASTTTGVVMGAFLGVTEMLKVLMSSMNLMRSIPSLGKVVTGAAAGEAVAGLGIAAAVTAGLAGGVMGGMAGYAAAGDAETVMDGIEKSVKAVRDKGKAALNDMKR